MMSSVRPSAKYSCSGSPLMFWNGRTAIEGLFGSGSGSAGSAAGARVGASWRGLPRRRFFRLASADAASSTCTSPTKRNPRLCAVRIRACVLPSSPIARRAALMREFSAASDTMRPCQTASNSSSLLTIRSRCCTQIGEHIEHLRFDRHDCTGAPQFLLHEIDFIGAEAKDQVSLPKHDANRTLPPGRRAKSDRRWPLQTKRYHDFRNLQRISRRITTLSS